MSLPRSPLFSRAARRGAVLLVLSSLILTAPAARAQDKQPNSATIQWAQQILDQQGLYQGRASGKMDSATAAAISAYQRKYGLKATGRLDQETIDQLMRDQPERKGVGNLADPNSRARSSGPMLKESEVKPHAAPAAPGVDRGQGSESTLLGASRATGAAAPPAAAVEKGLGGGPSILGHASPPAPANRSAAAETSTPEAAPRSDVQAEGLDGGGSADPAGFDPTNVTVPDWARYGLMGGIGVFILGVVANLWWSGRRRRPAARRPAAARPAAPPPPRPAASAGPAGVRREPTFGAPTGPTARREPAFTAPTRDPRRLG
ncbi:peptidoglycan-binding domain-containing protein [Niveispirillum sp. SYP-B3756]|uniref:peptidoglycan-binding domain-containing protein n=1 Tax=Niveispirillum sp. SYP-B3756 TaxID=2662178 RepID=UPI001FFF0696|nr:peptidoglycan-binding domain-containing protein [Niveispirillum sp. SYP-B3756]